jgi:hypothetical protein
MGGEFIDCGFSASGEKSVIIDHNVTTNRQPIV